MRLGVCILFFLIFKVQLMLCIPCLLCLDSTLVSCVLEIGGKIGMKKTEEEGGRRGEK